MADTQYRDNLVGADGKPLTNALCSSFPAARFPTRRNGRSTGVGSPGLRRSAAAACAALLYADARYMSKFNTGSDLDIEKTQKAFTVVNARIGIARPDDRWGIEFWAPEPVQQDIIKQVAFDAPIQGTRHHARRRGGLLSALRRSSTARSSASRGRSA